MNIRTFHTDRFTIKVEAEPDYDSPTYMMDEETAAQVMEDLHSGRLQHFIVKASVTYRGLEIATDYLGGCLYEHPQDFMDHRGMNAGGYGSYFSDMVRTVIQEARKTLHDMQRAAGRINLRLTC